MSAAAPLAFVPRGTGAGSPLERALRGHVDGEVLFDAASRGRYATDASIYQVMPIGVAIPRTFRYVDAIPVDTQGKRQPAMLEALFGKR